MTEVQPLNELFEVVYGNQFDLNKMTVAHAETRRVAFVGRSDQNNGVAEFVEPIPEVAPFPAGEITVALGGSILASFVQMQEFYTAQNVKVLTPRSTLSFNEKVYYCMCVRHNRSLYSAFGREANRTLGDLLVPAPSEIPQWVEAGALPDIEGVERAIEPGPSLGASANWGRFRLDELFVLKKGKRLTQSAMKPGCVPFIGASATNNGITAFVGQPARHPGGTISVSYNGSVGEAFYQPVPFFASDDVNVLTPRFEMGPLVALFVCTLIRRERYRFNYGRKWHLERMKNTEIRVPALPSGEPNWELVSRYMAGLRFSRKAIAE